VKAHRFSRQARESIVAAGGEVHELPWQRGGRRTR
jgi:hypothetical protein